MADSIDRQSDADSPKTEAISWASDTARFPRTATTNETNTGVRMTDTDPLDTLKRLFTTEDTESDDPMYECRNCGARFERQHTVCPDCGGRSIERANWETL